MRLIKKKNFKYIFLGILIFIILFLSAIKVSFSQEQTEPITYDFDNNSILNIDQDVNPNYYNIRNQSFYNGNYLAQYSFENEIGKTNYEISFIDYIYYGNIEVKDYFKGHSSYLNLTGTTNIEHNINNYDTKGCIEFWIYINESQVGYLQFYDSDIRTIDITFHSNGHFVYQNSTDYITSKELNYNIWTHYKLEWFDNNTFDMYENSHRFLHNAGFKSNMIDGNDAYRLAIPDKTIGFDGIDYDKASGYQSFRSLTPIKELNDKLEVDKYEFDYSYETFENDYCSWYQDEATSGFNQIQVVGNKDIDKYINFYMAYGSVYNQYLYFKRNSNSMILNISMAINPSSTTPYDYLVGFYIFPYNYLTSVDKIAFRLVDLYDNFQIYNSSSDSFENIFYYTQDQEFYVNIYINYYDNIVIYSILDGNDYYKLIYEIDLNNLDLYGFYDMYFYGFCNVVSDLSSFTFEILNVGIYESGLSMINHTDLYEFGLMSYNIDESWNSDSHNLLTIDSNNEIRIFCYVDYDYFKSGYLIKERFNQSELETINLQDYKDNNYPKFIYNNPYIIFQVYGNCSNMYEIEIEGIRLIDQNDNYVYGNYYYNSSNPLDNWFYVIDNKLYYNFNDSNNFPLETMRITFNVDDVLLDNESLISYSSYITNNYSGNIYVSSYYQTETFSISENDTLINSYYNLTDVEHFTLTQISIELETNNQSNGLVSGYIQNINIYPEKPLFPEFESIEYLSSTFLEKMIETIIPMLFFIVPSLLMRIKYGSKIVIPIWILMTFIFLIVNFIPFWICFIIFLAIGIMALNKKEVLE